MDINDDLNSSIRIAVSLRPMICQEEGGGVLDLCLGLPGIRSTLLTVRRRQVPTLSRNYEADALEPQIKGGDHEMELPQAQNTIL